MDYYKFFTTDNKSGWKTRENLLKKNEPEVFEALSKFCDKNNLTDLPFKERVWCFMTNTPNKPVCIGCGGEVKFHNRIKRGYMKFCNLDCANSNKEIMIDLQKSSMREKYGVDFFPSHGTFVEKQKKTKLERYGDENYVNLEKAKKTKLERYGNENYVNVEKMKQTCLDRYGVNNFSQSNEFGDIIINNLKDIYKDYNFLTYDRSSELAKLFCEKCEDDYEIDLPTLRGRVKYKNVLCTNCNNKGQSWISSGEQKIIDFIKTLGIKNIKISDRSVLGRMELDIYLPDYNLAIEYDGLYWHSDIFKEDDYHLAKTKQCGEKDIQLIHVFEDEVLYKFDIVKSRLKSILGLSDKTVYGRKCVVKDVSNNEARIFLDNNHIQGHINSKYKIGLYYEGELVSLMTFGGLRRALGGVAKKDSYELIRFANKKNTNVLGAASKLLKYFKDTYDPKYILSYADKRWSNGNLYHKLGFDHVSDSKPNYWYINNDKREHRFKYRKSVLVKEGFNVEMSERQIMNDRGYKRIYDCGNMKFEMYL